MRALLFLTLLLTTSCWRMPEQDEVSVLPATNNPSLTHQTQSAPWTPGVSY